MRLWDLIEVSPFLARRLQWLAEGRLAVLAKLYFFYALIVLLLPALIYCEMRHPILQQV